MIHADAPRWLVPLVMATALIANPLHGDNDFLGKPLARWLTDLDSRDAKTRRAAAFALGQIGGPAISAVPRLARLLRDQVPAVREATATSLGEIGSISWEGLFPALVPLATGDPDPLVRRSVAATLGRLGRQLTLESTDQIESVRTALERALIESDPAVRQSSARALGKLGPERARGAVPTLVRALNDPDLFVRRDAVRTLRDFGTSARPSAEALAGLVKTEKDVTLRRLGAHALVSIVGPGDRAAAAVLKNVLQDEDAELSRTVALALASIGGNESTSAVPKLCEMLRAPDATTRASAAAALARMGKHAAEAVPALAAALGDIEPVVRRNAALALTQMRAKAASAVPALTKLLNPDQPDEVRLFAVEALAFISPQIEPALPELLRVVEKDASWRVRQRGIMALGAFRDLKRPGFLAAFEAVLAETDDESKLVRYDAAIVAGILLGPEASERTIDVLQEMLKDPTLRIYQGSSATIRSGGGEAKGGNSQVVPTHAGDGRWRAVQALARIGKKAGRAEVLRQLAELANTEDEDLKKNVTVALKTLQR